jgi:hypothetical protein
MRDKMSTLRLVRAYTAVALATAMLGSSGCCFTESGCEAEEEEDRRPNLPPPIPQHTIGGLVSGLNGIVVLRENTTSDNIAITTNGAFQFPGTVDEGASYGVSVYKSPAGQSCGVVSGSGTARADVKSVSISCTDEPFSVGGMVSGAVAPIVLQLNLGDDMQVAANGAFTFPNRLGAGAAYTVTVVPDGNATQSCTPGNASGTINGNVSDVLISCAPLPASVAVGGSIAGLNGQSLTLQLNAGGPQGVFSTSTNGAFQFVNTLPRGTLYFVTVANQPAGQHCVVNNAAGAATPTSITAIGVDCSNGADPESHAVGGTVTGLNGALRLRLNKNNDLLTVNANGGKVSYTFGNPVPVGTRLQVTVAAQPAGQTCIVMNGGASMGNANITNILVECRANVTDPLSGTFLLARGRGFPDITLTLYPDGVYVAASAEFSYPGAGVEVGAYRYTAATGALRLFSLDLVVNSVDGAFVSVGLWGSSSIIDGTVSKTGAGQNQVLVAYGPFNRPVVLVPVPSIAMELAGSFGDEARSFIVFLPNGRYVHANANLNLAGSETAGVEFGCYTRTGTDNGTISVMNTGCVGAGDNNGAAGLSGLGMSLQYRALGPYAVDFGNLLPGSRVLPGR